MILSHPDKLLEDHINGVLEKYRRNCDVPLGEIAIYFHDLGKLNPNFQKKICGQHASGYSNHSYLSVAFFYSFLLKNENLAKQYFLSKTKNQFKTAIWQVLTIIAHHHGDLPNLSEILNEVELLHSGEFVQQTEMDVSKFISDKLLLPHRPFFPTYNYQQLKKIARFDEIIQGEIWRENSLANFRNTQYAFASVIEADKRDASRNEIFLFENRRIELAENLIFQLQHKFSELDNKPNKSELNKYRTEIRHEAADLVRIGLKAGNRIFSLPAPTGSGKTFTLLAIAKEILCQNKNLGIIYALPFLSITDQVQDILDDFNIECLPISSKSQNVELEKSQLEYESNPTTDNLDELLKQSFSENTFDHPFILTTFVQLFETLVSNKNSTLLKLPNFTNRIILLDEIQALPPRLYIFFAALLDDFCKKHNSYVVFSTGTMPKFDFPNKNYFERKLIDPSFVFQDYTANSVTQIIAPEKYFNLPVFNRYKIDWLGENEYTFDELTEHISTQIKSCLIILNTIADTKFLYSELKNKFRNVILLNTHFVVEDRMKKVRQIKEFLKCNQQVIVISTQLIEAGVDLDFPIVYRDLCPLPSLIQSAGRCNRNKLIEFGQVYIFHLINKEGKKSSELIYRKEAKLFLEFCKNEIKSSTYEKDLFTIQSRFFEKIKEELTVGEFAYDTDKYGNEYTYNFIECINNAWFANAGKFKLILETKFGNTYQYFIPENEHDNRYFELMEILNESFSVNGIKEKLYIKLKIETALKKISSRLLTVRIKQNETAPAFSNQEERFGIRVLSDLSKYSFEQGIELGFENCLL